MYTYVHIYIYIYIYAHKHMIVHINTHMNIHVQHRCSSCGEVLYISPMDAIMYAPGYMYACRVHYRGIRMCVCVYHVFMHIKLPKSGPKQLQSPAFVAKLNSNHKQRALSETNLQANRP